jgi:hypothetical protein
MKWSCLTSGGEGVPGAVDEVAVTDVVGDHVCVVLVDAAVAAGC